VSATSEPREFRYSRRAKARDVAVCLALSAAPGLILPALAREWDWIDPNAWHVLASWAFWMCPAVYVAARAMWRARVVVAPEAISVLGATSGPQESMAWADVESVRLGDQGEIALWGDGRRLRIRGLYENGLAEEIAARAGAYVVPQLAFRIAEGKPAFFRGGETRGAVLLGTAFVAGFLGLWLGGSTLAELRRAAPGTPGDKRNLIAVLGAGIVFLLIATALHLRNARWRVGGIAMHREGLEIRGWRERRRVPWSDVESAASDGKGRLVIRLRSGGRIRVPTFLNNFLFLEPLIRGLLRS
jgi:hypothetical protein